MPNSSLTAMYNQCSRCANTTIIAFQDENGFVQIGNLTSNGWTLTQLGSALDPEMGTGLALQHHYFSGFEDKINLYHQMSNLNMSLSIWTSDSTAGLSIVRPSVRIPLIPSLNHSRRLVTQLSSLRHDPVRLTHCRRILLFQRLHGPRKLDRSPVRLQQRR